jgi:hypothetical protein
VVGERGMNNEQGTKEEKRTNNSEQRTKEERGFLSLFFVTCSLLFVL